MTGLQKIGAFILGVAIAVASAAAWRFWQIDSVVAIIVALAGLGIACEACGIRDHI